MKHNYYAESLNSSKLYQVYQTQIVEVQQYLNAEIAFVCQHIHNHETALELGAGYGRIMKELAPYLASIIGIDISQDSIAYAKQYLDQDLHCDPRVMDVHQLNFDQPFDIVLCLQNGLSSLKGNPLTIIKQSMDLLAPNGRAFFSSYSPNFWEYRLAWFQEQTDKGLLGEIDLERTGNGQIICKDGFTATTYSQEALTELGESSGHNYQVVEVDNSSVFLIIEKTMQ